MTTRAPKGDRTGRVTVRALSREEAAALKAKPTVRVIVPGVALDTEGIPASLMRALEDALWQDLQERRAKRRRDGGG